jgi:Domain of unknown function (DUF4956)
MDTLIQESLRDFNIITPVSSLELIFSLILSTILCLVLARVYISIHEGYSYSKSFLHTMIIVGITIVLIMLIIGSNIARAFALVGAMSIIRFRNPVKDPRDVAFIFMAMAVGMACGVKFYIFAIIFTIFVSALLLILYHFEFGNLQSNTYLIKVRQHNNQKESFTDACQEYCRSIHIISLDHYSEADGIEEIVYEMELFHGKNFNELLNIIKDKTAYESINILVGESSVST